MPLAIFQLTTSRRGRRNLQFPYFPLQVFQLTTSRRGRPKASTNLASRSAFQLTTSRRGRRFWQMPSLLLLHFNSLPHAEVDFIIKLRFRAVENFNSLPHAEVDPQFLFRNIRLLYFNSLPHAEVDPFSSPASFTLLYFNSLPHAEVDVYSIVLKLIPPIFQLTTSRRGRQRRSEPYKEYFDISTHYLTQR